MKQEKTIVILPADADMTLPALYDAIAKEMGADITDEHRCYDCRAVDVSPWIQEDIYNAYRKQNLEEYIVRPEQVNLAITMLLARSGPKVDRSLTGYQVAVYDGYICRAEAA